MTIDKFTDLLIRSRLVTETDAKYLALRFRNDYLPKVEQVESVSAFCNFLIGVGTLTAWQCEKLRMGKWKGFYFDHFVLLDQVGKDETTATTWRAIHRVAGWFGWRSRPLIKRKRSAASTANGRASNIAWTLSIRYLQEILGAHRQTRYTDVRRHLRCPRGCLI